METKTNGGIKFIMMYVHFAKSLQYFVSHPDYVQDNLQKDSSCSQAIQGAACGWSVIVERFVFIDQSMVVSGKHDPRKGKNHVANFKTGTRVKRLRRSGALRPLVGDKITCFEDISSTFLTSHRQEKIPWKLFM